MPLSGHLPKIDDRTFDDIVAEIRTRIPRYTPEWTDQNDSDPGMTFIQLFAWLTDMLIFRLGKVPPLNQLKFLELLGIDLTPATPALAQVTFPVQPGHGEDYVIVPQRTQIAAETDDEAGTAIFETDRSVFAVRAQMASVLTSVGASWTDRTAENDEPQRGFQPFGPLAGPGNALLLGFTESLPQVRIELTPWVFEDESGPRFVACDMPQTAVHAPAVVRWEFLGGTGWQPANLLDDQTLAFTRSGNVILEGPPAGKMRAARFGPVTEDRFWLRAVVIRSSYEMPPRLLAIRTNTATVTQAETIRDEVLGASDGSPNQVFRLSAAPVLAGSLQLEIDEGEGFQRWSETPDFFDSAPRDRHYTLNRASGEIRFGDGVRHGAIPVANVRAGANVVAREFRIGGGTRGNVAARAISSLLTNIDGIDSGGVHNVVAAHGGREEESLEETQLRAQRSLKSKCRAVTAEDFETLAMQAANVKRAKALPLFHPDFPDIAVPGVVTVIVVPDSPQMPPTPSEATLRTVCDFLDQRRLLTTEVYLARPTYRHVEISGRVIATATADLAEVKSDVQQTLLDYFHPLSGGEDGQGWPFGGDVYYSRVYQRIFNVPGVDRIEQLIISVDGHDREPCTDVAVATGVLVYSTDHNRLEVNYDLSQGMIAADLQPPIPQPPHDPKWWLLDAQTGWRAAELVDLEEAPHRQALALAVEPDSGRTLTELSGSFGGLTVPGNVALRPEGDVYLLDSASLQLKRFDPCTCRFELVPCFGEAGTGPRQLVPPVVGEPPRIGIGISHGNLFVCDSGNHRLSVFALKGMVLRAVWRPPADADLPMDWTPHSVAFDRCGRVLVSDPANGCIHRFQPWGQWETCLGQLPQVTHIAVCLKDLIFAAFTNRAGKTTVRMIDAEGRPAGFPLRVDAVTCGFPRLPFEVDAGGNLHLGRFCVPAAQPSGPATAFDLEGNPARPETSPPLRYCDSGEYLSQPLDSKLYQCHWHRIVIDGEIPDSTRIKVSTYTAETEKPPALVQALPEDSWAGCGVATQTDAGQWDTLIRSDGGRFLWLRLELEGNQLASPVVERVRVEFPRVSLRRYLPAVFGQDPVAADFTDRFLALFDTTFRDLERTVDEQARLFDPSSAPATSGRPGEVDFLSWLASWIGVALDRQLPLATRRRIVKQAAALYHVRGTRWALWRSLATYLGIDRADACCRPGPTTRCEPLPLNCEPPPPPQRTWQPPPLILEHYRLRRWLFLGVGRLGDEARLWGQRIVNRSRLDANARAGGTQLKTSQDPLRDPFHVYAHLFTVFVPARYGHSPELRRSLENLLAAWRPAHTEGRLEFVEPRFRIGVQSMIGFDSVVGRYPSGVTLGAMPLGQATVLENPPHMRGGPTLEVSKNARIGTTTRLD